LHVPVDTWNKYYRDHEVEIATGKVQLLDVREAQAKEIAGWRKSAGRHGRPSAGGRPQAENAVRARSTPA
jgi:hypothetical protein